jgi:hypothetical protein
VVPYFEILMRSKTIHEATRNVISCPFRVISWIVLAQGKTTRNQFRALPVRHFWPVAGELVGLAGKVTLTGQYFFQLTGLARSASTFI